MEKKMSHITAGLIIAGVLIVYSMVLTFLDLSTNQALGMLSLGILIGMLIYFVTQYGKSVEHNATFGQLFSFGFKATAVATIISIAFQLLFFVIFPEYKDKITEMQREQMYQRGMTDAQVEQAMTFTAKFFYAFLIGGALVGNLIFGAIGSLIGAAITKKNPQTPFQQP